MCDEGLVIVTFKCPKNLLKDLDRLAATLRSSRSELIRDALTHYLKHHGLRQTMRVRRVILT